MNTNTNPITSEDLKTFQELLDKSRDILVLSHSYPDPDAICSMLLTRAFIKQYKPTKNVELICEQSPDEYIEELDLPLTEYITSVKDIKFKPENYDLVIIVDNPEVRRTVLAQYVEDFNTFKTPMIFIDHHEGIPDIKFTLSINQGRNSATEQIFLLFQQLLAENFILSEEISYITQVGIISDTNRFLFDKIGKSSEISSTTFYIMAQCKSVKTFNSEQIYKKLNPIKPGNAGPLAILLKNMQISGDCAYSYISPYAVKNYPSKDLYSAQRFFTDHYIRSIEDVNWGFIVKKAGRLKQSYRIIFRAVEGTRNIRKIAERLGGGGHDNASACLVKAKDIEDAIKQVLDAANTF